MIIAYFIRNTLLFYFNVHAESFSGPDKAANVEKV